MSDHETVGTAPTPDAHGAAGFLTAKAAAIAGFAVAVLTLTQQNAGTQVVGVLWGSFSPSQVTTVVSAWAFGNLVMVAVSVFLARRALHGSFAESWETHLARAAVLLATVAGAISALSIVVAVLRRATGHF